MAFHQTANDETIQLKFDFSTLTSKVKIRIEDLKTGQFHDPFLNDLLFSYDINFRKDRFLIHIEKNTLSKKDELITADEWFISQDNSGINIHLKDKFTGNITKEQ